MNNKKIKLNVKVKFFEEQEEQQGEYYLSVLLLEDDIPGGDKVSIDYKQNGTDDPYYTHDFVLRSSAILNKAYGELILTNPKVNEEFTKSYLIDLDDTWNDIYSVCIVWKYDKEGDLPHYKFVNSYKKK